MTFDHIIQTLRTSEQIPKDALRAALAHSDELKPKIFGLVQKMVDGVWLLPDDERLLFYGLYILAAAREQALCPVMRDLMILTDQELEGLFGDGTVDSLVRIVLSVYDGDQAALFKLLEARSTNWQARWALFQIIARLTFDGDIDRPTTLAALERFEREALADDDELVWLGWEDAVTLLGATELTPLLERVWKKEVFKLHSEVERKEALEVLQSSAAAPQDPKWFLEDRITPIDDPVEGLWWLERIEEESRKETRESLSDTGYDPAADVRLKPDELAWLSGFLECPQVPDETMSLEMLDGFFTALIVGPALIKPSEYLPVVWGGETGEGPEFDSLKQAQYVMDLMMRHWNTIAQRVVDGTPHIPITAASTEDIRGQDWAQGFLRGVDLQALRADEIMDQRTAPLLDAILMLTGGDEMPVTLARRAKALAELPTTVLALARHWRSEVIKKPRERPARSMKIGRNEPCPCGSGKKYKRCCGGEPGPVLH